MPPPADAVTDWEISADGSTWHPARVPGTVPGGSDEQEWWYRARLRGAPATEGEEVFLRLDGLATLADVYLGDELILHSDSMFVAHRVPLPANFDGKELRICFRALAPLLAESRKPRARWRPRLAPSGLRHVRTMILGRAPGFAPGPQVIGPWRPVTIERKRRDAVTGLQLRTGMDGDDGILRFSGVAPAGADPTVALRGPSGSHHAPWSAGRLRVPSVARWWPHTHGDAALHDVSIDRVQVGRVGFRSLESDGTGLRINGVDVFARGAVWTPLDFPSMNPDPQRLRATLQRARDAGMNMVRIPGTSAYETPAFHDLCDELGLLVWQDFMFANFDYPIEDERFRSSVVAEVREVLERIGHRPSTAVLCGNSEVEQQAAMLGRPAAEWRGELFGELIPSLIAEADVELPYVPSAPCGGDLPFRPGTGVANYYGVGGYRRPLADARLSAVRFAAECLAFSNLPDDDALADQNVPADAGADWDFADVRRHYATELYGPEASKRLDVNRSVTGEVMASVFGEWRRTASPCRGGLVLWLADLYPGAGWGVLDHQGQPKLAYHHLRRALAPVAVWLTDEGLGGLDVHVANDGPAPLRADLRIAFYRDHEVRVDEVVVPVDVEPGNVRRWGVEELLGRFVDASYAYRFGPPGFDVVVATLGSVDAISQAFAFPAGRPSQPETAEQLGLVATCEGVGDDLSVTVASRRLAHCVRVRADGYEPDDDGFSIEPGGTHTVRLRHIQGGSGRPEVTAINLAPALIVDSHGHG